MSRMIPNQDQVGNDYCLSPVLFDVPFIIVDNGHDCFWFSETMDTLSAKRMAFAINNGMQAQAHQVNTQLILPAASEVRATTAELHRLQCQPMRVQLHAP